LSDCKIWKGHLDRDGYGKTKYCGKVVPAHKAAWMWEKGPVPEGMVLDHLCRNRACTNVEHLEPVTNAENIRRGAIGILKVECKQGHPFTPENTYLTPDGRRMCKTCRQIRSEAFRRKDK
jgi:hypothetical protein